MEDRYIAIVNNTGVASSSSNTTEMSLEDNTKEQRELSHPYFDVIKVISDSIACQHYQKIREIPSSNPAALTNPYVRLAYATALDMAGYALLKVGKLELALTDFQQAEKVAKSCQHSFPTSRWNYEGSSLIFSVRKHLGDCLFERAENTYQDYLTGDQQYLSAIEFWNQNLSKPQKRLFANSVITNFLNLGNLYVDWARATGEQVGNQEVTQNIRLVLTCAQKAVLFFDKGRAHRLLSRQIKDQLKVPIPDYDQMYEGFEEYIANIMPHIERLRQISILETEFLTF